MVPFQMSAKRFVAIEASEGFPSALKLCHSGELSSLCIEGHPDC